MKSVISAAAIAATFALAGHAAAAPSQDELLAEIKALKEQNAALQKKLTAVEQAKPSRAPAATAGVAGTDAMAQGARPRPVTVAAINPDGCRAPGVANALQLECSGFSAYIGAMTMRQAPHGNSTIATPPTGTPGVLISGANFSQPWGSGPEAVLRYRFGGGWSVEGRYFNSDPSAATFVVPAVTTFRIAGIGVTILGGGALNGSYRSDIESAEFNVQKEIVPGFSVLAGYRHLNLDEKLAILLAGTGLNISTWNESNSLNGAQVGAKLSFWAPAMPIKVDMTGKVGAYKNSASNNFTSQVVGRAADSGRPTAYAAEGNLTASYYITPQLSLSATYMALWVHNVALADRAASSTIQAAGGTQSPVNLGRVWYNAASVRVGYDF